ncbi:MAG TPA: M13 family metallopeptidase [Polyangiaceae bacterium]|nr:M13 family metallopeptidase [Polyangiaceae bacterium]
MRVVLLSVSCVALAGLVASCGSSPPPAAATAPAAAPPAEPVQPAAPTVTTSLDAVGLDASALDRKADPCQDFYQFACGGWLAKTEIPADKSRWSRGFSEVQERNEKELKRILEEAAKSTNGDPITQKIGSYYGACMDETAVEKAGTKPIRGLMLGVKKVTDAKSLAQTVLALHKDKIWAVFSLSAEPDFKDATKVIAHLDQNGLGLPDRDYYLKDDDKSKEIRDKYVGHVERMMKLAGLSAKQAKDAAKDVMTVETEIARVSKTRVERRDPAGMHNKIDRVGLAKTAADFPWDDYFKGLGYPDIRDVNVTSVPFFEGMNKLLKSVKPAAWQNYLSWQIVHQTARALPKAFVEEDFTLRQALSGQKEVAPRWKRCVEATDSALGELLAQPFIKTKFAGDSKSAAESMVFEINRQFSHDLEQLDWMDGKTKERATSKLKAMEYLIGYPSKWKSYDFEIDPKSYGDNMIAAHVFELKRDLAKVGKPVDRQEWLMSPPTVNAYYDPQKNHMVFPAGILQPPFYSAKASVAVNLGGIGMVVGHELTHGFDDEGSQFAGDGNLSNWWEPESGQKFKAKTQCVDDQYGGYETVPGVKLNGRLTLGENVADGGGVMLAFRAYREIRKNAKEVTVADGFNEDQQFFLAVGQAWCSKQTDQVARMLAQVDPHSPPKFRVNGSLANLAEFSKAFSCAGGTPMHAAQACKVW